MRVLTLILALLDIGIGIYGFMKKEKISPIWAITVGILLLTNL